MASTEPDFLHRIIAAHGPLDEDERRVFESIRAGVPISRDAAEADDEKSTLGDRLSDRVAAVGGSWGFIISFGVVLAGWMVLNTDVLARWGRAFDPYPYIFLNLLLSTLAAIQAPVIMMSQNRQAAKDRLTAQLDYQVNLRAELEILRLHDIIDVRVATRFDSIEAKLDKLLA
jgi:uncharacterized membrane protein